MKRSAYNNKALHGSTAILAAGSTLIFADYQKWQSTAGVDGFADIIFVGC